jgi:hypothetical protein
MKFVNLGKRRKYGRHCPCAACGVPATVGAV